MASFWAMDFDANRDGVRRLLVALAGYCLLSMGAHAQPAGAAPTATDVGTAPTSPTPTQEPAAAGESAPAVASGETKIEQAPEDPQQAVLAGQRLVTLTEQQFGKNSRQNAEAYRDLAEAQRRAGDHDAAEKSYLSVIEIYRAMEGVFTPLVIEPLTALGDNYRENNDYLSAITAYTEARTVNRRTYGLLNSDQIPLLDRITRMMLELNKPAEADAQQVEALRIVERSYPPESDEALAALYKYSGWLRDQYRFQEERDQYARALRTVREHYGKEDLRQVRALLETGNSFRVQRLPDPQGAGSLQDALQLMITHGAPDKLELAEVLRDIGDWQVAFTKVDYDGAEYRRAWQFLGEVPNGDKLRQEWFTGPNYVLSDPISTRGLSYEPTAPLGHVTVKFDLDKSGHTSNVAIVESDPPGLKDEAVLRHIRRSRFRPQLVDGEPVARESLARQFNYRYMPDAVAAEKGGKSKKE